MTMNHLNRDDIEQKVMAIIADKATANKEAITIETTVEQIGLDSLDLVEIILEIEDTFECLIEDQKIEELESIEQIVDYIYAICKK